MGKYLLIVNMLKSEVYETKMVEYIEAVAKLQFCNSNLLKMHVS
jgi:hypothetical protein